VRRLQAEIMRVLHQYALEERPWVSVPELFGVLDATNNTVRRQVNQMLSYGFLEYRWHNARTKQVRLKPLYVDLLSDLLVEAKT
jgi:predicted transcriptional regulator